MSGESGNLGSFSIKSSLLIRAFLAGVINALCMGHFFARRLRNWPSTKQNRKIVWISSPSQTLLNILLLHAGIVDVCTYLFFAVTKLKSPIAELLAMIRDSEYDKLQCNSYSSQNIANEVNNTIHGMSWTLGILEGSIFLDSGSSGWGGRKDGPTSCRWNGKGWKGHEEASFGLFLPSSSALASMLSASYDSFVIILAFAFSYLAFSPYRLLVSHICCCTPVHTNQC